MKSLVTPSPQSYPNVIKLNIFLVVISIVVLSTQMHNTKMRSSKVIIGNNAQKQMARFGFWRKFCDLNYFDLEFITHLRSSSNNFVENHQANVILSYFKKHFDSYLLNATTCTPTWTVLWNMYTFLGDCFCQHKLLDFVDQYV